MTSVWLLNVLGGCSHALAGENRPRFPSRKAWLSAPCGAPEKLMSDNRLIVGLEEGSELRGCLEERNRIEGLQGRGECVGKGPHRARCELRVGRLEVVPMDIPSERARNAKVAF